MIVFYTHTHKVWIILYIYMYIYIYIQVLIQMYFRSLWKLIKTCNLLYLVIPLTYLIISDDLADTNIFAHWHSKGALSIAVIIIEDRNSDPGSNPGLGC